MTFVWCWIAMSLMITGVFNVLGITVWESWSNFFAWAFGSVWLAFTLTLIIDFWRDVYRGR